MEFVQYPKWKYHLSLTAVIIQNAEEEQALGEEWLDSPADFALNAIITPKKAKK